MRTIAHEPTDDRGHPVRQSPDYRKGETDAIAAWLAEGNNAAKVQNLKVIVAERSRTNGPDLVNVCTGGFHQPWPNEKAKQRREALALKASQRRMEILADYLTNPTTEHIKVMAEARGVQIKTIRHALKEAGAWGEKDNG